MATRIFGALGRGQVRAGRETRAQQRVGPVALDAQSRPGKRADAAGKL